MIPRVRITPNITETELQKLKLSENGRISGFDWTQIIVAVAGVL